MTVVEASRKWGFGRSTILAWCKDGLIDGAVKKTSPSGCLWEIPDNAKSPEGKRGRATSSGQEHHFRPVIIAKPEGPLTLQEIEGHLRRFATSHTYKQLQQELGIPRDEIREIYDRLHAQYGI